QCPTTAIGQNLTVEDRQKKFQSSSLIIGRPCWSHFSPFQCLVEVPYRADTNLKPRVVLYDIAAVQAKSCWFDQYSVAAAFPLEYHMPTLMISRFVCYTKSGRSRFAYNGLSAEQIFSQ